MEIHHTTFVLFKQIRHISRHPRITSNMDMVINGIQVHIVLKIDEKRAYLDSKLVLLYGNQEHLNNKYETNSCISSRRIKKINISSKQYWRRYHECRAPTKALINFAWVDSINSMTWNYGVCSCLRKLRKIKKFGWKSNKVVKMHAGRKMTVTVC